MTAPQQGAFADLKAFVLDVLPFGHQQIPFFVGLLNLTNSIGWRLNWPHEFAEAEVTEALKALAKEGHVTVLVWDETRTHLREAETVPDLDGPWNDYWYKLSVAGRQQLDQWIPPERVGYDELK